MFSMKHISRAKLSKKEHLKQITIVKKFVNWCTWEGIDYPLVTKD